MRQSDCRLPSEEYERLWRSIAAETGDPLFPLRSYEAIRSAFFSPPLFAALRSPNPLITAQRIAQDETLTAPLRFHVMERDDIVIIELVWLDAPLEPPASLVVMELLFCPALARTGGREQMRPIAVETVILPEPRALRGGPGVPYPHE